MFAKNVLRRIVAPLENSLHTSTLEPISLLSNDLHLVGDRHFDYKLIPRVRSFIGSLLPSIFFLFSLNFSGQIPERRLTSASFWTCFRACDFYEMQLKEEASILKTDAANRTWPDLNSDARSTGGSLVALGSVSEKIEFENLVRARGCLNINKRIIFVVFRDFKRSRQDSHKVKTSKLAPPYFYPFEV